MASEAKMEVKSLISIKTLMNSENSGHLWYKMSQIYLKNSKVFEQKGDLLNFKANIDPRAVLSRVKPDWVETSWVKLSGAESSWVKLSQAESSRV